MCCFNLCKLVFLKILRILEIDELYKDNPKNDNNDKNLQNLENKNETNLTINLSQSSLQTNVVVLQKPNSISTPITNSNNMADIDNTNKDNKDKNKQIDSNNNNNNEDRPNTELIEEVNPRPSLIKDLTQNDWNNEVLTKYENELKNAIIKVKNSLKNVDDDITVIDPVNSIITLTATDSNNANINEVVSPLEEGEEEDDEPTRRRSSLFRLSSNDEWNENEMDDYENELKEQMKYLAYLAANQKQNKENRRHENDDTTTVTATPLSQVRDGEDDKIHQKFDLKKLKEQISVENEDEIRKQIEFLREQLQSNNQNITAGNDIKPNNNNNNNNNNNSCYYYYYYYNLYCQQQQQQQQQNIQLLPVSEKSS